MELDFYQRCRTQSRVANNRLKSRESNKLEYENFLF